MKKNKKKAALYSFHQARQMARSQAWESVDEFWEYDCPGAYQLPKNPHEVWPLQWKGWEDFLGLTPDFVTGRIWARRLGVTSAEEYQQCWQQLQLRGNEDDDDEIDPASRLPYRPDLHYKNSGWQGWKDWLGVE